MESTIEKLNCENGSFDFITVGRALHWLNRAAGPVLERIVAQNGCIAIIGSSASAAPLNEWTAKYKQVRNRWASEPDETRYRMDLDDWFFPTRFRKLEEIEVKHRHTVTIDELVARALSFSTTSAAVLGEHRPELKKP